MKILFTAHEYCNSLTERVYMNLLTRGKDRAKYSNLEFTIFDMQALINTGDINFLREACKTADFIYHYGTVFQQTMLRNGGTKELISQAHALIFDEFRSKSVCRNEKVCEDKNPDRKDFQYQAVIENNETDRVPLIPSYSFLEMKEKFENNEEIALPIVFKDPRVDNGWGCFLIQNQQQLAKIFDDELYVQAEQLQIAKGNNYLSAREACFFQEFIESEPAHPQEETHARILIHATARKILGFVLFLANKPQQKMEIPSFDSKGFVSLYSNPSSPLYLNAQKVKPSTFEAILVYSCNMESAKPLTPSNQEILHRHDLLQGEIPDEVQTLAYTFAEVMAKNGMGGLIGIDLIHDVKNRKWRLLEGNFPASGAFEALYGYDQGRRTRSTAIDIRIEKVLETWQNYAKENEESAL